MVITKSDVKKQLHFTGNEVKRPVRNCTTKVSAGNKGTTVDLGKCSSASFENLLGEGATTGVISTKTSLKSNKKAEDRIKMQMLLNLNNHVLHTDAVTVAEAGESDTENDPMQTDVAGEASKSKNLNGRGKDRQSDEDKVAHHQNKTANQQAVLTTLKAAGKDQTTVKPANKNIVEEPVRKVVEKIVDNAFDTSDFDNPLDATMPLFKDTEAQTEQCYILCTCIACKDIVRKFSVYINRGFSEDCTGEKHDGTLGQGRKDDSRLSLNCSSLNQEGEAEDLIPLFKGSKVKISVTAKGRLKCLDRNPEAGPKEYVYAIMDDLYDPVTMANMTAAGRASKDGCSMGMAKHVKDAIIVYLQNKFEDIVNINEWVNNKCYCERRKLWGKKNEAVRKPLKKNVKKEIDGADCAAGKTKKDKNHSKTGKKASEKKKKRENSTEKARDHKEERNEKKRRLVTEDTSATSKKFKKSSNEHESRSRKEKGTNTPKKKKSESTSGTFIKRKPQEDISKHNKKSYSPSSKSGFKRKPSGSNSERAKVGGKCPKPVEEILRISALQQSDDEYEQPSTKYLKGQEQENSAEKKKNKPKAHITYENEFSDDLPSSTPHLKKFQGKTTRSLKGSGSGGNSDSSGEGSENGTEDEDEDEDEDDDSSGEEEEEEEEEEDGSVSDLTD